MVLPHALCLVLLAAAAAVPSAAQADPGVGPRLAAKDDKKDDDKKDDDKKDGGKGAPPEAGGPQIDDTNAPEPWGSGYESWGTAGGATLGAGDGVRANFIGGSYAAAGASFFGLEAYYILGMSPDFDVFLGGRLSLWYFGLVPGARIRYRILAKDELSLALDIGAYAGFLVGAGVVAAGPGPGFVFSTNVYGLGAIDPGLMASYFVKDNMEIIFGAFLPLTFAGGPFFYMTFGVDIRGGFVYTFKKINLGAFAFVDFVPGVGVVDTAAPGLAAGFVFAGGVHVGIQYRF